MRHLGTLSVALAVTLAACPAPLPEDPGDAGSPDGGAVDTRVTKTHAGAFLGAFTKDVLPGVASKTTIVALQSTFAPDVMFGGAVDAFTVFGGLAVIDGETGAVRIHDEHDGLPLHHYFDVFNDYGEHATSTFDLAWIRDDRSFAAAGLHHAIRGVVDDSGNWAFTSATLRAPGKTEDATLRSVAHTAGELHFATDQGLAVLDDGTLATKRWAALGVSVAGPWVDRVVAADLGGAAVVATFGPVEARADRLSVIPSVGAPVVVSFGENEFPVWLAAVPGGAAVAVETSSGGAIDLVARVDGEIERRRLVGPESLLNESGEAVVPRRLAWDGARSMLLVGGSLDGSGLVELSISNGLAGEVRDVFDRRDAYVSMLPWQYDAFMLDGSGRLWTSGVQLCSEHKLRPIGLLRIDGAGDREALRVTRPVISGVRALAVDPVAGDTWLGLRDENAGFACDGVVVQQQVCRPRADGTCEIWTPRLTTDTKDYSVNLGASAIAFGDSESKRMAIATRRDATWVRIGDETRELSTQLEPGLSLDMTAAAFGPDGALWLGSEMNWAAYPDLDEDAVNRRGPHGLGLLTFEGRSAPSLSRRYVREKSDTRDGEVEGLPSNTVWDVLPLPGTTRALVACGIERDDGVIDHLPAGPNRRDLRGGLAIVDGSTITTLTPPSGTRFGDVVALARKDARHVLALDASLGVFTIDLDTSLVTKTAEIPWNSTTRGLSLATDGTRILAGATNGTWLHDTNGWRPLDDDVGFTWKVGFNADGTFWAGSDAGLTTYAAGTNLPPTVTRPAGPLARDPWPLPLGCHGERECVCDSANDCASGLRCDCVGDGCTCTDELRCRSNDDCDGDDTCGPDGTCVPPESPGCAADCSCATTDGCPDGQRCQGGIVGFSCVPE